MKTQKFYQSHLSLLLVLFKATGSDLSIRNVIYWLQNLMSESIIPADFKLEMIEKAKEAGVPVSSWLHP